MFEKVVKLLFTTRYGLYALVALVIVGAAYGGKVYYETEYAPAAKVAATSVEQELASIEEALSAYASKAKEGESSLPANAPWTPKEIECGVAKTASQAEAANETWKALGVLLDKPTVYQYRFRGSESAWHLIARTDSDCDGVYKVYHLRGTVGWEGVRAHPMKIDNPSE